MALCITQWMHSRGEYWIYRENIGRVWVTIYRYIETYYTYIALSGFWKILPGIFFQATMLTRKVVLVVLSFIRRTHIDIFCMYIYINVTCQGICLELGSTLDHSRYLIPDFLHVVWSIRLKKGDRETSGTHDFTIKHKRVTIELTL